MKKASGFKMKNPSVAKLAKAAGSPMKQKLDVTPKPNKGKKSFDQAYQDRDMKLYGGLNKADYIKEAKRQKAVKESKVLKKGGTYDVPKKPMVSESGGAKTSVGTTEVKKTTPKKTDAKKTTNTEVKPKTKKQQRQEKRANKNKEIKAKQAQRTAKLKKFLRGFGPKKNK